ncbi:MAG: radical SAM protein [Clostridiales bacterium]|nr:radical SAM protein [Clostridiales bacterium]
MPHIGCPHRCSFCNQNTITGQTDMITAKDVVKAVEIAVKSQGYSADKCELAFFGGSFTAIDRDYMLSLLNAAQPYINDKKISGIRISTRPDAIDGEILCLLKEKGVTSIELGAQSADDEVLKANMRGHTAKDIANASKMISDFGFSLGLQMMTGLYKSSPEKDKNTAVFLRNLNPDTMRIYPTAVLKGTCLEKLYLRGEYTPYTFEQSVELCAELLSYFEGEGVKVIRLGLHDSESLKESFAAGVYHPSFRELCLSRLFYKTVEKYIKNTDAKSVTARVNPKDISAFVGNKRENIEKLNALGVKTDIIQDSGVTRNSVTLKNNEGGQADDFKIFGNTGL